MDENSININIIGHVRSDFPEKFGIPRQSGRIKKLRSVIVLNGKYKSPEALRGLEGFSHLWVLWIFSQTPTGKWSPTVRPPRLGGNRRMGVFATRSPYRPNPIGMSALEIEKIEPEKGEITVLGGDILDGTPIIDIKPYLPSADRIDNAVGGFADGALSHRLNVAFGKGTVGVLSEDEQDLICDILADDPRPSYQNDPDRIYGMDYADISIKFKVNGNDLTIIEIKKQ